MRFTITRDNIEKLHRVYERYADYEPEYNPNHVKPWFACMYDNEDDDWSEGSYVLEYALDTVLRWKYGADYEHAYIAVIDDSNEDDPFCLDEIDDL